MSCPFCFKEGCVGDCVPEPEAFPEDAIAGALMDYIEEDGLQALWPDDVPEQNVRVESYASAGVLTNDAGFVLTIGPNQYQVTVIRSR